MLKVLNGEIYRLLHKKSLYIYFGILAVGYFTLAFIRSGGFSNESVVSDALNLFILLPALAGGFLFAAIYTDDLNSKSIISLVGSGVNKAAIIAVKFTLTVLFGTVVFGFIPLFHISVYAALGQAADASMATMIFAVSLKHLLTVIAYSSLSGIVVYGLQRTTFAIVTYLLLAFGVVGSLISAALGIFAPNISGHLVSGITDRILFGMMSGAPLSAALAEYVVYVLVAITFSIVAFLKKEMEF